MENALPVSVDDFREKQENYIDEKFDQVAIKYLKEELLNDVKQQFSPSIQGDKTNAELVKILREQIENLQYKYVFYAKKRKKTLLKMITHSKGSPKKMTLFSLIYRQYQSKNASQKTLFH